MKSIATMMLPMIGVANAMPTPSTAPSSNELHHIAHNVHNLTSPEAAALTAADMSLATEVAKMYGSVTTGLEEDQQGSATFGGRRKLSGCTDSISYNPSYEVIPTNVQAGSAMIGGCSGGGTFFQHKKYGQAVSTLTAYTGKDECPHELPCIKGIAVSYFGDNDVFTAGDTFADGGNIHTYTFNPGETIEEFVLTGNGAGTRLGHISFTTSSGGTFSAGTANTRFEFRLGGPSMISGIFGAAGSQLERLGFSTWKPVASMELKEFKYPTLSVQARVNSPDAVYEFTYCNPLSSEEKYGKQTVTKTVTTGTKRCFKFGTSFSFSQQIKITAGASVPGLVKAETESTSKFEAGVTAGFDNCQSQEITATRKLEFPEATLAPHTSKKFVVSQWTGQLTNLKFTCKLVMTFQDGKTWSIGQQGTYDGTYYSSLDMYWADEKHGVQKCG